MRERPILFSGGMVRAILEGRKTQTRRIVKPQFPPGLHVVEANGYRPRPRAKWLPNRYLCEDSNGRTRGCVYPDGSGYLCGPTDGDPQTSIKPYAIVGDLLWVRETWWRGNVRIDHRRSEEMTLYAASAPPEGWPMVDRWHPSIHMKREHSRLTLEVVGMRVERLQRISEADARAEGATQGEGGYWGFPGRGNRTSADECDRIEARDAFRDLWDCINGRGAWESNPWVWVVEFRRAADENPSEGGPNHAR